MYWFSALVTKTLQRYGLFSGRGIYVLFRLKDLKGLGLLVYVLLNVLPGSAIGYVGDSCLS